MSTNLIRNVYIPKKKFFLENWTTFLFTSFDRINPFTPRCGLIFQLMSIIESKFWPSAYEATSNWRRGGKKKRRKVFKQLLNPKAYGTAIYALTWKTRIQRERRILCMYTSWETGFPSSHPFIPGKNNPRNASCNRQPVVSLETRETFKHDPDIILFVSNLSSRYYEYQ